MELELTSDCRDHPRIRGEHGRKVLFRARSLGIIPAYAGSTYVNSVYPALAADHPRIRGEHDPGGGACDGRAGSSPHTRGALSVVVVTLRGRGIIPAYAGSTDPGVYDRGVVGDHPRIRGEHSHAGTCSYGIGGSSPHTRGAPRDTKP